MWLISIAAGSTNLYHIVFSPNHLSVCIQGFKNTPYLTPVITLLEMYPKDCAWKNENGKTHKDVLCTVIYNGGIMNIQQQDTVRRTVTYPHGWNILWL